MKDLAHYLNNNKCDCPAHPHNNKQHSELHEQLFCGIPGVPEGWGLLAVRVPMKGEWFVGVDGKPLPAEHGHGQVWPIIRKIEKPKKYRAFANKAEYEPHRARWWKWKDPVEPCDTTFPPIGYGENGLLTATWEQAFQGRVFDDGSPFGIEVKQ
jgi:hypothetical protein